MIACISLCYHTHTCLTHARRVDLCLSVVLICVSIFGVREERRKVAFCHWRGWERLRCIQREVGVGRWCSAVVRGIGVSVHSAAADMPRTRPPRQGLSASEMAASWLWSSKVNLPPFLSFIYLFIYLCVFKFIFLAGKENSIGLLVFDSSYIFFSLKLLTYARFMLSLMCTFLHLWLILKFALKF